MALSNSVVSILQTFQQGVIVGAPVMWSAGHTATSAIGLISDADASDVKSTLTLYLEHDYVGDGKNWVTGGNGTWTGGGTAPNGSISLPSISDAFSASQSPPKQSRVRIHSPNPLSVGFLLTAK